MLFLPRRSSFLAALHPDILVSDLLEVYEAEAPDSMGALRFTLSSSMSVLLTS